MVHVSSQPFASIDPVVGQIAAERRCFGGGASKREQGIEAVAGLEQIGETEEMIGTRGSHQVQIGEYFLAWAGAPLICERLTPRLRCSGRVGRRMAIPDEHLSELYRECVSAASHVGKRVGGHTERLARHCGQLWARGSRSALPWSGALVVLR